jgi:hypothetical protein
MSLVLQADFVVCLKTSQFFLKKSHHNGRSKNLKKPVQQNYDHQSTRLLKTQSNYEEFVIIAHNNTNNTNSPNKTPPTHQPTPE